MNVPERLRAALEGRYRMERPLGEGGMATVYMAHDVRHDRSVAIKVLRPELAAVIGGERFLTEIRTTANLQHPHILPLFDSGEADSFLYYVMPYVQGESLRQRLDRERQLPIEEAVRIAGDVAGALDYAHRQSVIHRDIKPANILLHDGRPLVADFGIALALSAAGGGRLTETGLSLGTPHYMSPEQAAADRDLTARSDVYSLGAVLYETLAGDPPHTGPSAQAVLVRILTEEARPLTDERRAVPPNVAATVAKALEKLPADRFESASAFQAALADPTFTYEPRPAAHSAGSTRVGSVAARPRTRVWLRDARSLATVGVAAAAIAFAGWGVVGRLGAPDPFPVRMNLDVGAVDPSVENAIYFDISPDGRTIAMTAAVDGEWGLWVKSAEDARFRLLPQTEGAWLCAFSPDGEWIVYGDWDETKLLRVPVSGGAPFTVVPEGDVEPWMPHWGRDGSIVFASPDGLYRVRDAGDPELILADAPWAIEPRLLPDGSGVLFTDGRSSAVSLLDLATDSTRVLIPEGVAARYVETGHLLFGRPEGGLYAVPFDLGRHEVTGDPVRVLDDVSVQYALRVRYAVSRDGTLVYGSGILGGSTGGAARLLLVDLAGAVDTLPLAPRLFNGVRWSPDGRRVAYASGDPERRNIFIYDVELGTTPRQLTFEGDNLSPEWSPDGTRIAFGSTREGTDDIDLFVRPLDDTPEVRILARAGFQFPTEWPLADVVLYNSVEDGTDDLWMIPPDSGAVPSAYLRSEADLYNPTLAPGGRLAAYESDESGTYEIYVRSFPEPRAPTRVSEGGGEFPSWSRDGSTLYYWDQGGPTDTLWAARVELEPVFRVLTREVAWTGENLALGAWDLHPDGDRFVVPEFVTPAGADGDQAPEERFFVVVNWFEEMRARLGETRR